jgi:hypothetical protein
MYNKKISSRITAQLYVLAFLFGILTLMLWPIHCYFVDKAMVSKTLPNQFIEATASKGLRDKPGHQAELVRFSGKAKENIAKATIVSARENTITLMISSETLPLGLHGRITQQYDDILKTDIGSINGITKDKILYIFKNHQVIARGIINSVSTESSLLRLEAIKGGQEISLGQFKGLLVSEFEMPTMVVFETPKMLWWFELLSIYACLVYG